MSCRDKHYHGRFLASFKIIFVFSNNSQNKNCCLQQDSNSNRRSIRQARWPFDHYHLGTIITIVWHSIFYFCLRSKAKDLVTTWVVLVSSENDLLNKVLIDYYLPRWRSEAVVLLQRVPERISVLLSGQDPLRVLGQLSGWIRRRWLAGRWVSPA